MIRKSLILVAALGLFTQHKAHAEAHRLSPMKTGNFLRLCNDTRGKGLCDAYLAGVADGGALIYLSSVNKTGGGISAFCVPDAETTTGMRTSVVRWLQGHRAIYGEPVGKAVVAALHQAYPCHETEATQ